MFEIIFVRNNSISSVYDNIRSFSQLVRRLLKSFTNADDNFEIAGLGDFFFFFDVPSGATTMCVCVFFFFYVYARKFYQKQCSDLFTVILCFPDSKFASIWCLKWSFFDFFSLPETLFFYQKENKITRKRQKRDFVGPNHICNLILRIRENIFFFI